MSIRKLSLLSAISVLFTLLAATASACPPLSPDCQYDATRRAWFYNIEVDHFVQYPGVAGGTGPNGPSEEAPDTLIYLIGNVNDGDPFAPAEPIPAMDPNTGAPIFDENGNLVVAFWIPDHDHVWTEFTWEVSDGFGMMIVAGPNATANNVKTRPMPPQSLPGAPLAYQIKLGTKWFDLNNAFIIELGLRLGLLDTFDIGWGGTGWFEFQNQN